MHRIKRSVRNGLFITCLIANPAYFTACVGPGGYKYDEDDMLTLLDEVNEKGTFSAELYDDSTEADDSEASYTIELSVEQGTAEAQAWRSTGGSFVQSAHACGDRSFVKSAAACDSTSSMPLVGHLLIVSDDPEAENSTLFDGEVRGGLTVYGNTMGWAEIRLPFDTGVVTIGVGRDQDPRFSAQVVLRGE